MDTENLRIIAELAITAHLAEATETERIQHEMGRSLAAAIRRLEDREGRELPAKAVPLRPPFWWVGLGCWPQGKAVLGLLAAVDGGGWQIGRPYPPSLRTPLLEAVAEACRANSHPWIEAEADLARRSALTGTARLAWSLRDLGLWPLPRVPEHRRRRGLAALLARP